MTVMQLDPSVAAALLEAQAPLLPAPERARALREKVLGSARASLPGHPLQHLTVRADEGVWTPLLPGIQVKMLREDAGARSYLLRMAAGARLPGHGHLQEEECMVLEGDIWLGETHARAGDYHLARVGVPHGELRSEGGCLLYLRGQKRYPDLHAG